MKVKVWSILAGVAVLHLLLLAGISITGGCKGPEVLGNRPYIAAPSDSVTPEPGQPLDVKPTELAPLPPADHKPAPVMTPMTDVMPSHSINAEAVKYTVQKNDSFWKIGRKYGVSSNELMAYNKMSAKSILKIGQVIMIPPSGSKIASGSPKSFKSFSAPASVAPKKKSTPKTATKAKSAKSEPVSADGMYVVKSGDSIWKIAAKHHVKISELTQANNLKSNAVLQIGQKLAIPKKGVTGKAVAVKTATTPKAAATPAAAVTDKNESADDILDKVTDPSVKATPAPDATTKPAEGSTVVTSTTAAIPTASALSKTDTVEVSQDINLDKFAKQYGIKVEDIKGLNPDLPKDGMLKAGKIVIIPAAE
ncbi:MAG: LysM peptidoglycan-binding domain-containing protein [Victivallaceae bacterium]